MQKKYDFVVVGSGIAGMSFALKVAHKGSVALLCKTELTEANTMLAQGGISSVTNYILDNYEKHIEDTLIAGDGICDRRAVGNVSFTNEVVRSGRKREQALPRSSVEVLRTH